MATTFFSLEEVRSAIDRLDHELVRILADRSQCVSAAVPFKSSEKDVRAPERLTTMIAARREWARESGLDPEFIEALFRLVTSHFISRELREWDQGSLPA